MTCDYAILLYLNSGVLGFSSEMADDPLLNYYLMRVTLLKMLKKAGYVAITRAKHRNYLLAAPNNSSKFVNELQEMFGANSQTVINCPDCKGSMMLIRGPFNNFYGCSNYPECEGKRILTINKPNTTIKTHDNAESLLLKKGEY